MAKIQNGVNFLQGFAPHHGGNFLELFDGLLNPESLKNLLSSAANAKLTEWLVIGTIVWKFMGSKVEEHFKSIEKAVMRVAAEVAVLREAVTADLQKQQGRLEILEDGVLQLRDRVKKLEKGEA